ncbi:DUF4054 domain-containing protein, partial [Bacillus sp. D-CC]
MDVQTFREKFSTDSSLMSLPDAKIQDALEEADLIVSQIEFGALKERAVGLYAAHILTVPTLRICAAFVTFSDDETLEQL